MKKDPGLVGLIITTVCVALINITNLLEYIDTGDKGKPVPNALFIASIICIVIGWIVYICERKKNKQ